jgi:hypothetical protein
MSKAKRIIEEVDMFEMSNLRPDKTGLSNVIWVSYKGKAKHGPRIKIVTDRGSKVSMENMVSMTISDDPKVIGKGLRGEDEKLIRDFVIKNKDVLLDYWEGNLDTAEMVQLINKV